MSPKPVALTKKKMSGVMDQMEARLDNEGMWIIF